MSKLSILIAAFLISGIVDASETCTVDLQFHYRPHTNESGELMLESDLSLDEYREQAEKLLANKGYIVEEHGNAQYQLKLDFGNMMTTTDCFTHSAYVVVKNDLGEKIAEARKKGSELMMIFGKKPSPRKLTLKALKRLSKKLPVCIR